MKIFIKLSCSLLALVFMYSCLSQAGKDLKGVQQKEKASAANRQDIKLAAELDGSYKKYIMKYPEDTNLPRMVFEDAQVNIYPLHKNTEALRQLETVYTKYPQSRFAPNALFKAAFLNETQLQNMDEAKRLYALFIKTYPTNSLANDAKISLENIGLSPDEQLKKIQATQDSIKNQKKIIQ